MHRYTTLWNICGQKSKIPLYYKRLMTTNSTKIIFAALICTFLTLTLVYKSTRTMIDSETMFKCPPPAFTQADKRQCHWWRKIQVRPLSTQPMLQIIQVVDMMLVYFLMQYAPYAVFYQILIRRIWWPKVWWNEVWSGLSWILQWSQQRFINGVVLCQLVWKLAVDITSIVTESINHCLVN